MANQTDRYRSGYINRQSGSITNTRYGSGTNYNPRNLPMVRYDYDTKTYTTAPADMNYNNTIPANRIAYLSNRIAYRFGTRPEQELPIFESPLTKELNARKENMFDYNNPNEVNSYADIIMNTLTSLFDKNNRSIADLVGVLKGTALDTSSLLYKGTFKPLLRRDEDGKWSPDTPVLVNNFLVNFSETADLVDNVWKGFVIGSGVMDAEHEKKTVTRQGMPTEIITPKEFKFSFKDGVEGMRRAIFERENFDYDTGNRVGDFIMEMATPTNIALWLMGAGGASMGKQAAGDAGVTVTRHASKEAADEISQRALKAFSKNYTGDAASTFAKMPMNLTKNEMDVLTKIAEHATNFKVLKGVNTIKRAVDVVDSFGPRLAIKGTVGIPWKIIRAGYRGSQHAFRYTAHAVENLYDGSKMSLISTLAKRPEHEFLMETIAEGAKLVDESVPVVPFNSVLRKAANNDITSLKKLVKNFRKVSDSKSLINEYVEFQLGTKGIRLPWETAQEAVRQRELAKLLRQLDDFAAESSDGLFKTFDQYVSSVKTLYNVTDIDDAVKELYEVVNAVSNYIRRAELKPVYDATDDVLQALTRKVDDLVIRRTHTDVDIEEVRRGFVTRRENIKDTFKLIDDTKDAIDTLNDAKRVFGEQIDGAKKEIEALHAQRTKEYTKAKAQGKVYSSAAIDKKIKEFEDLIKTIETRQVKVDGQVAKYTEWLNDYDHTVIEKMTKELEDVDLKIADLDDVRRVINNTDSRIDVMEEINDLLDFRNALDDLVKLSDVDDQTKVINKFKEFVDDVLVKVQQGAYDSNRAAETIDGPHQFGEPLIEAVDSIHAMLNKLRGDVDKLFFDAAEYTDQLFNTIYPSRQGEKIANDIIANTIDKLKHTKKTAFEAAFDNKFLVDGVVDEAKYLEFLDSIAETTRNIRIAFVDEGVLFDDANNFLPADMRVQVGLTIDAITRDFALMQKVYQETGEVNLKLLEDIVDELYDLKNPIQSTARQIKNTIAGRSPNIKNTSIEELTATLTTLEKSADSVDSILDHLDFTEDVFIEYVKDGMSTYIPRVNNLYRNYFILKNADLEKMLQAVGSENWSDVPIIESLQAIRDYNTPGIDAIRIALETNNMPQFNVAYHKVFNRAFDPVVTNLDDFKKSIDMLAEVKDAATTIMSTLEGMVSVRKLHKRVTHEVAEGLDKNVASTFMDALQRFYNDPATLVKVEDLHKEPWLIQYKMEDLFDNIDNQLRNQTLHKNTQLSKWRDRLVDLNKSGKLPDEAIAEYNRMFGSNMAHTSVADSYSEYLIHKHILKDDIHPLRKYVYMDLEGSGTSTEVTRLYQQSVVIPETGTFKWYINTDVPDNYTPSTDHVYYLLFGDEHHTKYTISELKESFQKIYQSGNSEVAEAELRRYFNYSDDIDVIFTKGEADMLTQSKKFVETQKPPNGRIIYRIHNGSQYDVPLWNNRARALGLTDHHISAHSLEDTRVMLEDMLKIKRLSRQEREVIEDIVMDYVYTRKAEITSAFSGVLNNDTRKFLPSMGPDFRRAYSSLENIFNPINESKTQSATQGILNEIGVTDLFSELKGVMGSVYDTLQGVEELDKELSQLRITVAPAADTTTGRLLPDGWFDKIPKHLKADHAGIDIFHINNYDGIYVPVVALDIDTKPNLVLDYFDVQGPYTDAMFKKMTAFAGDIQRRSLYIRNPDILDSMEVSELHTIQAGLLDQLQRIAGPSYLNPAYRILKYSDNKQTAFATVDKLYSIYKDIASANQFKSKVIDLAGDKRRVYEALVPLYEEFHDTMKIVADPYNAGIYKRLLSEYGDDAKFFTVDNPIEHYKDMFGKAIKTLEELDAVQDQLEYARLMRVMPIYRGMHDSFETFHQIAEEIAMLSNKEAADFIAQGRKPITKEKAYSILRSVMESQDSVIAYKKLERVLGYKPNDMASFLRHQAKGYVIFDHNSLYSANYFPKFRPHEAKDVIGQDLTGIYKHMLDNRAAYEKLGIGFDIGGDFTIIYLKADEISKLNKIPYKEIVEDFKLTSTEAMGMVMESARTGDPDASYILDRFDSRIRTGLLQSAEARQNLLGMTRDGGTSTLEVLDDIAMDKLLGTFSGRLKDGLDIDTLKHMGMFDGNLYNHSVLGHIDGRRKLMPYSSFNPAKNMYNAAQLLETRLGTQLQYLKLMQAPEFMVKNLDMEPQGIVDYLKKAPHLKVVFLNGKTKGTVKDFKLSTITMNGLKDVKFAKEMNAVVVDVQTYMTARAVINNDQITNPILRLSEKLLVGTFKLGWLMYNPGLVMRNLFDTATKNMVTAKEQHMAVTMAEMTKNYFLYQLDANAIAKYAADKKVHINTAVDEFFATQNPRLSREIFDRMAEYQIHNGSVGMVKGMQKYYGDTIDTIYRRLGDKDSGLAKKEFREFMKMPDEVAERWLVSRFANDRISIRRFMDAKGDLLTYKRAYEMQAQYKFKDLSVDDFVVFLKSKRVPAQYQEIFEELLEKTKHVRLEDDVLTKVMTSRPVAAGMSANMHVEEVLRMSLYEFLRNDGYSTREAMADIVRTHFDYDYKSKPQRLLEMIMPFSTFRTMNLQYWAEEMDRNPQTVEFAQEYWKAASQFNEREQNDVLLRRSLQYQIETGNIILNEDTGLTMKLNPSFLDLMSLYINPKDYLTSNLHSAAQSAWNLFTMEQYEGESEEAFLQRRQTHAWNTTPLIGGFVNRWRSTDEEDSTPERLWQTLLLAPLFNTTWTPEQLSDEERKTREFWRDPDPFTRPALTYNKFAKGEVPTLRTSSFGSRRYPRGYFSNRYGYKRSSGSYRGRQLYPRRYSNYFKRSYPRMERRRIQMYGYRNWSQYSTFNRTMYGAYFKFRRGSAYPTKNFRSLNTAFSDVWRTTMSKKGNPKYRFLSFPTNKWTLKLKVNILRNMASYNRWQ